MAVVKSTGGTLAICGEHHRAEDSEPVDMVLVDQMGGHVADYLDSMRPFR